MSIETGYNLYQSGSSLTFLTSHQLHFRGVLCHITISPKLACLKVQVNMSLANIKSLDDKYMYASSSGRPWQFAASHKDSTTFGKTFILTSRRTVLKNRMIGGEKKVKKVTTTHILVTEQGQN